MESRKRQAAVSGVLVVQRLQVQILMELPITALTCKVQYTYSLSNKCIMKKQDQSGPILAIIKIILMKFEHDVYLRLRLKKRCATYATRAPWPFAPFAPIKPCKYMPFPNIIVKSLILLILLGLCGWVGEDVVYHACGHEFDRRVPIEVKFF